MAEANPEGQSDPALVLLASRAVEVLVTHNEPVSYDDLACALGVSSGRVGEIANVLQRIAYVVLDETSDMVIATPRAADANDATLRADLLASLQDE